MMLLNGIRKKIHHILLLFALVHFSLSCGVDSQNKSFVIVTASYNNKDWYEQNLRSIFNQTYPHWRLIYIDDCSPDGTGDLVEHYIAQNSIEHKVTLIKNKERRYALPNQYDAVCSCLPHEIVVMVDGDDWLVDEQVLSYLNEVYSDLDVWMTYGQYKTYPENKKGIAQQIPLDIIAQNTFREFPCRASAPRTFYAWLFQKINRIDLLDDDGNFFRTKGDVAFMLPWL